MGDKANFSSRPVASHAIAYAFLKTGIIIIRRNFIQLRADQVEIDAKDR
jgi:hypothetical protein